ncbi:hypothetical protein BpHYR1_005652 [Brachionus plicatilis]|uniref:Uncharacterized protein n=1 Tax=Brachionus plicatilis TaxID=10195 RepID=A0A3M7PZP4_BRAPC|nr:hypothetical protein BpHYR1_005652 [Brachionus plicatilis]
MAPRKIQAAVTTNHKCCKSHLDNEGLIKSEYYSKIRTKMKSFNNLLILCLTFQKLVKKAYLRKSLCLKITGWTKE